MQVLLYKKNVNLFCRNNLTILPLSFIKTVVLLYYLNSMELHGIKLYLNLNVKHVKVVFTTQHIKVKSKIVFRFRG